MSQTGTIIQINKETSNGVIIAADGSEIPFTASDVVNGGFGELEFRSLVKYSDNPDEFWISAFTVEPPTQAFQRSWGFDEHKKAIGQAIGNENRTKRQKMGFLRAVRSGFSHYWNGGGRASRSEFWYWQLFCLVVAAGLLAVEPTGVLLGLFNLVTFFPGAAVSIRRLHDVNLRGLWFVLWVIPLFGWAVMLYFHLKMGDVGSNEYGPDPQFESS